MQRSWCLFKIILYSPGCFKCRLIFLPTVSWHQSFVCWELEFWLWGLMEARGSGGTTAVLLFRVLGFIQSIFVQCFATWDTRELFHIFYSLSSFSCLFLGFGPRTASETEVSVTFSLLMAASFPCSAVPTLGPSFEGDANSLMFCMMDNWIGNKSTLKFIGSSQGLVSRVIKHLIISGNVNCVFNFICTLTFALAKNSVCNWDWKGELEREIYELGNYW